MKRSDRLGTRCRPDDKRRWEATAKREGLSLSAWVEQLLNREVATKVVENDENQ